MDMIQPRPLRSQNNAIRRKPLAAHPVVSKPQHVNVEAIEMQSFQSIEDNTTTATALLPPQSRASRRNPFSSKALALIGFIVIISCTLIALVILSQVDQRSNGFYVAPGSVLYSWKFGPTAYFVVVIAFWRLLDYHLRCRAAWNQMAKGPTSVSRSLLLDYLSPLTPVAFVTALRNRHWSVALGIAFFACMKITMIFSTSLLELEPTMLRSSQTHVTLLPGGQNVNKHDSIHDQAAMNYLGARQRNLTWPVSTLPNAAFQELSPYDTSLPVNSTVSVDVRAFYPSIHCEVVDLATHFMLPKAISEAIQATQLVVSFNYQNTFNEIPLPGVPCVPKSKACDAERLVPLFQVINPDMWHGDLLSSDGILVALISLISEVDDISVPPRPGENMTVLPGTGWSQSVAWSSALACTVNYSIEVGRLDAERRGDSQWINIKISDPLTRTGTTLLNYSEVELTSDFRYLMGPASEYLQKVNRNQAAFLDVADSESSPLFELMLFEKSADDIAIFKDPPSMVIPLTIVFQGLMSALVGMWLSFPDDLVAVANYSYEASRLRVSESSLWLVSSWLVLALACVSVLLFVDVKEVTLVESGSPVRDAILLKRNPLLCSALTSVEHASDDVMRKHLSQDLYHTQDEAGDECQIILSGTETLDTSVNGAEAQAEFPPPWTQMAMETWFVISTLSLGLLIVIGLEVIQRRSDVNGAGFELTTSTYLGKELVTILPALVMVVLAMMFTSIEFAITVTFPYVYMTRKAVSIVQVQHDPLRQLPPVAIAAQLRIRHFSVTAIMFAALIGSTLTVIVSGLYTLYPSSLSHISHVLTTDEFDFTRNTDNFQAGARSFTYIQRGNQRMPAGTHGEVVYPLLELDTTDSTVQRLLINNSTTSIQVLLPVIRPSLNCTKLDQADLILKADEGGTQIVQIGGQEAGVTGYREWANVTSVSDLSASCRNALPAYHDTTKFRISTKPPLDVTKDQVSHVAQANAPVGVDMNQIWRPTSFSNIYNNQYPAGCPSIAFTIGTYTLNQTSTLTTTRLICTQYFEGIPASINFLLPDLELDVSRPLILHEDQSYIASMAAWNFTNIFQYAAGSTTQSTTNDSVQIELDSFFEAVIGGTGGVPFERLQGPDNVETLIEAVQHIYRLYMVQVIGSDMRITNVTARNRTANDSISSGYHVNITRVGTSYPALIEDPSLTKIVQNRTPKMILQIVVVTMLTCLLLGWRDLRTANRILPHNPCTIAGRMSYLASSRLVECVDTSMSTHDNLYKQLASRNARLRFGWWEAGRFTGLRMKRPGHAGRYAEADFEDDTEDLMTETQRVTQKRFGIDMVN